MSELKGNLAAVQTLKGSIYKGSNIALDATLTQEGMAADAKAVGDALAKISGISMVEPAEDDIPKVFFGGPLQQTKTEAVVPFRYISKTQDVSGYAEIKAQGNSSMSYPKKNQTVKLYKDAACEEKLKVDFKGWGKQNKHVYKANWIDITHARNVVSARLWADVVKSRANYAALPELLRTSPNQGAMDGFPIKVYANGVYQGRYTLNIPKDKWAFNMDDDLDTHCVLCGENYVSGCFRAAANINGNDWSDEIHDTVPASIKTRWNEVISFVMNSTDEDFKANLGNYFDVESLLDYHLFGLMSCGLDAYGKNQLYMTYDGQKWIASMYDMDSTWGLWWTGASFVATDYDRSEYQDFKDGEGNLLYIRLEELFYEELQARWAELRSGALSIENIINRFERFTDIAPAELVKEDYASTTGDGKFTGIPSKTTSTIQQIRAYAVARHAWCDTYVAALAGEVEPDEPDVPEVIPCTGITLSASTLTFTGAGSQTLTATVEPTDTTDLVAWSVSPAGIATVSGGVVTAVENGSCTITATCGEQSATCAVTVSGIGVAGSFTSQYEYSVEAATIPWGIINIANADCALFEWSVDPSVLPAFAVPNEIIRVSNGFEVSNTENLNASTASEKVSHFQYVGKSLWQIRILRSRLAEVSVAGFLDYLRENNVTLTIRAAQEADINVCTEFESGIYDNTTGAEIANANEKRSVEMLALPTGATKVYGFIEKHSDPYKVCAWFWSDTGFVAISAGRINPCVVPSGATKFSPRIENAQTAFYWFAL